MTMDDNDVKHTAMLVVAARCVESIVMKRLGDIERNRVLAAMDHFTSNKSTMAVLLRMVNAMTEAGLRVAIFTSGERVD